MKFWARPRLLSLQEPRPLVRHRGHPLGQVRAGDRHQGPGRQGQPRGPLARGRQGARRRGRRHPGDAVARQGDLLRRQGVRSRRTRGLPQERCRSSAPWSDRRAARDAPRHDRRRTRDDHERAEPRSRQPTSRSPRPLAPAGRAPVLQPRSSKLATALQAGAGRAHCRASATSRRRRAAAGHARADSAGLAARVLRARATLPAPSRSGQDANDLITRSVLRRRAAGHRARLARAHHAAARRHRLRPRRRRRRRCSAPSSASAVWAMRGLDPIFQVLRTVPPLAWLPISLAAFRDSAAVGDLRDLHHRRSGRSSSIPRSASATSRRTIATSRQVLRLNQLEFFWQHHDPVGGALHLHRPAHRHRPLLARHRRGRDAHRRRRHRLLHLGRVELLAPLRHRRRARLHRRRRLRPRPPRRARRPPSPRAAPQPS